MSDESVRAALRSDAPLVVVEAPAGDPKTHQGADYARAGTVSASSAIAGFGVEPLLRARPAEAAARLAGWEAAISDQLAIP